MKAYPKYIESGESWIGAIPEGWRIVRIAKLFSENKIKNSDYEFSHALKFNYGNLIPKGEEGDVSDLKETYIAYTKINKADIAINCLNLNYDFVSQRVAIAKENGIITSAYLILSPRNGVNSEYYNYFFKAMDNRKLFHGMGTGIRLTLSYSELKKHNVCVPSQMEQQTIVLFLNEEIARINDLISEAEKEISLLNELKQAEIAHMVTCGINPNVPMKDSGIAWIGKIPAHWQLRKMKFLFEERTEKNHPNEPILCSTQAYGVIPQSLYDNRVVVVNTGFENLKLVEEGDFVISLRSFQGGIEYAHYRGIISAAYTILRSNGVLSNDYTRYLFKCFPFIQLLKTCVKGIREGQNINYDMLRNNFLFIPPKEEQKAIVSAIDENNKKIDTLTFQLSNQITYLKELKQRVISDAVTGKIDVRDYKN